MELTKRYNRSIFFLDWDKDTRPYMGNRLDIDANMFDGPDGIKAPNDPATYVESGRSYLDWARDAYQGIRADMTEDEAKRLAEIVQSEYQDETDVAAVLSIMTGEPWDVVAGDEYGLEIVHFYPTSYMNQETAEHAGCVALETIGGVDLADVTI